MHKILLCIFFWWITIFLFSAFYTIKIVGVCLGWGVNCNRWIILFLRMLPQKKQVNCSAILITTYIK